MTQKLHDFLPPFHSVFERWKCPKIKAQKQFEKASSSFYSMSVNLPGSLFLSLSTLAVVLLLRAETFHWAMEGILNCMPWWNALVNAWGGWVWSMFHHEEQSDEWWHFGPTQPTNALSTAFHHSIQFKIFILLWRYIHATN